MDRNHSARTCRRKYREWEARGRALQGIIATLENEAKECAKKSIVWQVRYSEACQREGEKVSIEFRLDGTPISREKVARLIPLRDWSGGFPVPGALRLADEGPTLTWDYMKGD